MKWFRFNKKHKDERNRSVAKVIVTLAVVLFLSPGIIITAASIRGEGITFSAIMATMETAKVMNNIMDKDFTQTTKYIGFWEHCDKTECKKKTNNNKQCFINGLQQFFYDNRELVEYSKIEFSTDDYFTEGSIELVIAEERDYYTINLNLTRQNDKLYPMNITSITTNHEDSEKLESFTQQLKNVLYSNSSEF